MNKFKNTRTFVAIIGLILFGGVNLQAAIKTEKINIAKALYKDNVMPVAIIGAGPAGLSAAVYTARAQIPTYVFTGGKLGGYLNDIKQIENFPATPRITGEDLAKRLEDQATGFGAQIIDDSITSVDFNKYPFELTRSNGDVINALAVVVATGFLQEKLDIPGAQTYWGNGIGMCTICDAPFARGQDVAVIGDDDFAAERVIQLAEYANHVIMITRKKKLNVTGTVLGYLNSLNNAELITGHTVTEVAGDGSKVTGIKLRNLEAGIEKTLPVSTVYLNSVYKPDSSLVKDQLDLDGEGYIVRACDTQQTSVPGVFACGAVTNKPNKAGPSAGFGMATGVEVIEFMHKTVGYNSEAAKILEKFYYQPEQKRSLGTIAQVTSHRQLNEAFKENPVTVLFAYSSRCQFCKAMYPDILDIAQELQDHVTLVKLDANDSNELTKSLSFDSVPTTFIYKNGVLVDTIRGRANKMVISNVLKGIVSQGSAKESAPKS